MDYVRIPAGELQVKVKSPGGGDSLATVVLADDFWMARTEVTVAQFSRFVEETGYVTAAERERHRFTWRSPGFAQNGGHPVVQVSFEDARAYAGWAEVDLPDEAEWLYACRAGTDTRFYWGDSLDDRFLWHRGNTSGTGTRAAGSKPANPWGLFNMVGNVREYVQVCDSQYAVRGSSWTRCPSYKLRQGCIANDMIPNSIEPRLTECAKPQYPPYPWDDDRGFRCVRRTKR